MKWILGIGVIVVVLMGLIVMGLFLTSVGRGLLLAGGVVASDKIDEGNRSKNWDKEGIEAARGFVGNTPELIQQLFRLPTVPPSMEESGQALVHDPPQISRPVFTTLGDSNDRRLDFDVVVTPGPGLAAVSSTLPASVSAQISVWLSRSAGPPALIFLPAPFQIRTYRWLIRSINGQPVEAK